MNTGADAQQLEAAIVKFSTDSAEASPPSLVPGYVWISTFTASVTSSGGSGGGSEQSWRGVSEPE